MHTLILKIWPCLEERSILQDRSHPAQAPWPPAATSRRGATKFPGLIPGSRNVPFPQMACRSVRRRQDMNPLSESMFQSNGRNRVAVPVHRTVSANMPVRRAATPQGTTCAEDFPVNRKICRHSGRPAKDRIVSRTPCRSALKKLCAGSFRNMARRTAGKSHNRSQHRLLSATILFSRRILAGPRASAPARSARSRRKPSGGSACLCAGAGWRAIRLRTATT